MNSACWTLYRLHCRSVLHHYAIRDQSLYVKFSHEGPHLACYVMVFICTKQSLLTDKDIPQETASASKARIWSENNTKTRFIKFLREQSSGIQVSADSCLVACAMLKTWVYKYSDISFSHLIWKLRKIQRLDHFVHNENPIKLLTHLSSTASNGVLKLFWSNNPLWTPVTAAGRAKAKSQKRLASRQPLRCKFNRLKLAHLMWLYVCYEDRDGSINSTCKILRFLHPHWTQDRSPVLNWKLIHCSLMAIWHGIVDSQTSNS